MYAVRRWAVAGRVVCGILVSAGIEGCPGPNDHGNPSQTTGNVSSPAWTAKRPEAMTATEAADLVSTLHDPLRFRPTTQNGLPHQWDSATMTIWPEEAANDFDPTAAPPSGMVGRFLALFINDGPGAFSFPHLNKGDVVYWWAAYDANVPAIFNSHYTSHYYRFTAGSPPTLTLLSDSGLVFYCNHDGGAATPDAQIMKPVDAKCPVPKNGVIADIRPAWVTCAGGCCRGQGGSRL